jgi:hypothetical protein
MTVWYAVVNPHEHEYADHIGSTLVVAQQASIPLYMS